MTAVNQNSQKHLCRHTRGVCLDSSKADQTHTSGQPGGDPSGVCSSLSFGWDRSDTPNGWMDMLVYTVPSFSTCS